MSFLEGSEECRRLEPRESFKGEDAWSGGGRVQDYTEALRTGGKAVSLHIALNLLKMVHLFSGLLKM